MGNEVPHWLERDAISWWMRNAGSCRACTSASITTRRPAGNVRIAVALGLLVALQSPTFEVASIRPYNGDDDSWSVGPRPGGGFNAERAPLRGIIRYAYGLESYEPLDGGPRWIDDRFTIAARGDAQPSTPAPAQSANLSVARQRLQALLAARFKLAVRWETRQLPSYSLVLGRSDGRLGPRLQQSKIDCLAVINQRAKDGTSAPAGNPLDCVLRSDAARKPGAPPDGRIIGQGHSMGHLAAMLARQLEGPLEDRTGLTGPYAFELTWSPEAGPSLSTALQEQLGLKLDARPGPVRALVIERVEPLVEN